MNLCECVWPNEIRPEKVKGQYDARVEARSQRNVTAICQPVGIRPHSRRSQWLKDNAERVREYKRRSANKAYAADPDKFRKRSRDWRQANRQQVRKRDRIYRRKYAEKRKATFSAWRQHHRDYYRARNKQDVDGLAEWYVRAKLSRATCLKPSEWPASLVQLMRANLKVKRLLWLHQKTSPN